MLLVFACRCLFKTCDGYFREYINFAYEITGRTTNGEFPVPVTEAKWYWGKIRLNIYKAVKKLLTLSIHVRI